MSPNSARLFTAVLNSSASRTHGALYDKLHLSHEGDAGPVPIVHKSAAVSEVVAQLAIQADDDPQ